MDNYPPEVKELLPDYFCLDSYSKSVSLDRKQWYDTIKDRLSVENFLLEIEDPFKAYTPAEVQGINERNMRHGFGSQYIFDTEPLNVYELLINPMSVSDHRQIAEDMKPHSIDEQADINDYSSFASMGVAFTSIDLEAPDEILKKSFDEWLRKTRQKLNYNPKRKVITDSVLWRWQSNKVIEYLDLSQWFRLRQKSLPDFVAAAVLFPNDFSRDTQAVISKTTKKKLIPEILNKETSYSLLVQAAETEWKENR